MNWVTVSWMKFSRLPGDHRRQPDDGLIEPGAVGRSEVGQRRQRLRRQALYVDAGVDLVRDGVTTCACTAGLEPIGATVAT